MQNRSGSSRRYRELVRARIGFGLPLSKPRLPPRFFFLLLLFTFRFPMLYFLRLNNEQTLTVIKTDNVRDFMKFQLPLERLSTPGFNTNKINQNDRNNRDKQNYHEAKFVTY